jgi:hypothetical protein
MPALFKTKTSFTVPAGAGSYAPERAQLNVQNTTQALSELLGVTAVVESLAAGSIVELWLLELGTDPTNDANFYFFGAMPSALGGQTWALASTPGGQLRCKSGGAAGTTKVSASADGA